MELVVGVVALALLFALFGLSRAAEETRPCGGREEGEPRCPGCPLGGGRASARGPCPGRPEHTRSE